MTQEERDRYRIVTPFFAFLPLVGDLFVTIGADGRPNRYFWPGDAGFEEVSEEEGFRRVSEALASGAQP